MTESPDRLRGGWAAIYCRISDDREGAGLGVARQEQDCRPICLRRGYPNERIRVYADNDKSAYSGKPRPEYARLLADIRSGEVTFLTAWHTDRLHRSPLELEEFITIVEAARIDIEIDRAGGLDLQTPSGRMIARQLGAFARYESEHKAERQRRKCQELAELGRGHGRRWTLAPNRDARPARVGSNQRSPRVPASEPWAGAIAGQHRLRSRGVGSHHQP